MVLNPTSAPARSRGEELGVPPSLRGVVSRLLRSGLMLALLLIALGVLDYLVHGEGLGSPDRATGLGMPFGTALASAAPGGFLLLGLIVLFATPLARVGVSTALFASIRDWTFTALTLFVLLLLGTTIVVGALA